MLCTIVGSTPTTGALCWSLTTTLRNGHKLLRVERRAHDPCLHIFRRSPMMVRVRRIVMLL